MLKFGLLGKKQTKPINDRFRQKIEMVFHNISRPVDEFFIKEEILPITGSFGKRIYTSPKDVKQKKIPLKRRIYVLTVALNFVFDVSLKMSSSNAFQFRLCEN